MLIEHSVIARINRLAKKRGLLPATIARKATGDPRGLERIINKLKSIEEVEEWLDRAEMEDEAHLVSVQSEDSTS